MLGSQGHQVIYGLAGESTTSISDLNSEDSDRSRDISKKPVAMIVWNVI